MKNTVAILTALSVSALSTFAGTAPSSGKAVPAATPSPMDPCAGPISYNNVELLYAYTDWDHSDDHGNGGIVHVEYSPFQNFYLALGGEYHEVSDVDIWAFTAGIGGYVALTENIHLAVDGGLYWEDLDVGDSKKTSKKDGSDSDEFGWYVRPHVRARWGCFEVHAGAQYTKVDDLGVDEWAAFADLYYQVSPTWDLTAGVRYSNERTLLTGGARFRF